MTTEQSGGQTAKEAVDLTVVVPMHNEAGAIGELCMRVSEQLDDLELTSEVLLVDDGSTDATAETALTATAGDPRFRLIRLARNYGQTAAMSAGFDASRGRLVIAMDADLQNDPADFPRLLAKLDEGYDVVGGWRRKRNDSWLRVVLSRLANRLVSAVSGVALRDVGCSLKAYRGDLIRSLRLYGEMHRLIPALAAQQGARVTEIEVRHEARSSGKSHYGNERVFKVLIDLLTVRFFGSFQSRPSYVFAGMGLLFLLLSGVPTVAAIGFKFMPEESGWQKDFVETPLLVLGGVFFSVGVLAVLMGLLAEMLMRTYFESQSLPTYALRRDRRAVPAVRSEEPPSGAEPDAE